MENSILLYPILLISLYFLLFGKLEQLFYYFLFSTPFTATSLLNIAGISISFPIFIGLFLIFKYFFEVIKNKKLKKIYLNKFLLIFIICCLLSTISPLYIKSEFKITTNLGNEFLNYQYFPKWNSIISHILYLGYCYVLYLITISCISLKKIEFSSIIKVYKNSFYAVFIFIISEIVVYKLGLTKEFNQIFKMNESAMLQGYGSFLRIAGPNLEPSMLSIYLLVSLGIFYFTKENRALVLTLLLGILSTSSSFILGLGIYFIIFLFRKKKKEYLKIFVLLIVGIVFIIGIITTFPQLEKLFMGILDKVSGEGISGSDRKFNMLHHLLVSLTINTFLGIGYGVARSKDLISTWLVNIGYIGVISFIIALFKSTLNKKNKRKKFIGIVLIVAFIVESVSVPEPYFLYLWCLWGILDSKIQTIWEQNNENKMAR